MIIQYAYFRVAWDSHANFVHTHPQFRQHALLYRGFANERRLFILTCLLQEPRTGKALVKILNVSPSTISRHLRMLITAGLVYGRRNKQSVKFYAVKKLVNHHFFGHT